MKCNEIFRSCAVSCEFNRAHSVSLLTIICLRLTTHFTITTFCFRKLPRKPIIDFASRFVLNLKIIVYRQLEWYRVSLEMNTSVKYKPKAVRAIQRRAIVCRQRSPNFEHRNNIRACDGRLVVERKSSIDSSC